MNLKNDDGDNLKIVRCKSSVGAANLDSWLSGDDDTQDF